MKKLYRYFSLAMVFIIIFNFTGCFDPSAIAEKHNKNKPVVNDDAYTPVEDITFNLAYLSTDSINPYEAQSEINRNLTPLIYDSLYAVDNSFRPIALIAESSKLNDGYLTVTIKSGLTFSDGSFVTVSDVIYSFDKAKECERYKSELSCFESAEATGAHDVSFMIKETQSEPESLLTFPVIKLENVDKIEEETTTKRYNYNDTFSDDNISESVFNVPTGSGRYFLAQDKNKVFYLQGNTQRLGGYFPQYKNIGLVATADTEQLHSMYSLGRINMIFDTYNTGEYTQIIGSASKIVLPNFIYLVPNKKCTALQDPVVRKAISYTLDRKELCDYSFIGNAVPTELPFYADYYKTADIKQEKKTYNDAIRFLESNGYSQINPKYNFRYKADDASKVLEFRLAVCKNNKFKVSAAEKIKEQLNRVNIRIELYKYEESDFFNVLSSGAYDLYIGESKMKNNLDLSGFFTAGNSLSTGIDTFSDSAEAYSLYKNNTSDINSFIDVFEEEYPFIPLLYRNGNAFSNALMGVTDKTIVTDYYYNIEKWKTIND